MPNPSTHALSLSLSHARLQHPCPSPPPYIGPTHKASPRKYNMKGSKTTEYGLKN